MKHHNNGGDYKLLAALTVYRKEIVDALRDRRTLLTVLISSVLMGPAVLFAISALVASLESRAEQREVYVVGIENAPSLKNFLERQTAVIKAAPPDYEAQHCQTKLHQNLRKIVCQRQ